MGRASTWKNKPTSSLPVPIFFKPVLREVGRAIDAAEAVSFEREVTDCDGTILSLAIAISVVSTLHRVAVPVGAAVEPVEVESVEERSLDVDDTQKLETLEPLAVTEPEEIILEDDDDLPTPVVQSEPGSDGEPELPELNTPEQSGTPQPVSDHEGDNAPIDLPEVISIDSDDSGSGSSETGDAEPLSELETPIELPVTVTIPTVILNEGLEISAIAQTHPAPPDPYVDLPATALAKTSFIDQLYQAWMIESGGASNPQLLEEIYQNHFSSILGVTFLRKVEQSINLPGSGMKIHINLGASETYKLKNGLTLEGISFSHAPEQKGESNGSTTQAQALATIALSVIGTCVVASSVLAFMPGMGMKGVQHISPAIPSKYK